MIVSGRGRTPAENRKRLRYIHAGGDDNLVIGHHNTHIVCIGTLSLRLPDRNLAALAPACESDDFVAIQRQDA